MRNTLVLALILAWIFWPYSSDAATSEEWFGGSPEAIWSMSPGFYKLDQHWYIILHTQPDDEDVSVYGDFTQGLTDAVPLQRNPDGFFWWFKGKDSDFPSPPEHGDHYRFSLTRDGKTKTFQDPAARWVTHSELRTGWSRILDSSSFLWTDQDWQRPQWSYYNIYQLHPLRFTDRNQTSPFGNLIAELDSNHPESYLSSLGVTALQLLPVNEFAGDLSWGYNPSFFFAVESSYGGPDQLKALVDKAHSQGIAVILDVEYNHLANGDNILRSINESTYIDGDTVWGPLYNFNDRVAEHFLIQNILYLAQEYHIDGFRFDHTNTIHNPNSWYVTKKGMVEDGLFFADFMLL